MTAKEYSHLLNTARSIAYSADEAQDLLQEALIIAITENRLDFSLQSNQKWLAGVMRKKALQESRTISRRKKRDEVYTSAKPQISGASQVEDVDHSKDTLNTFLNSLAPAARKVAILIMHGLNRSEICTLLSLKDTAFRQRLTTIRKALGPLPPAMQQEVMALAYASRHKRDASAISLPVGLIRKALLRSLTNDTQRSLGTHDPSGHLIVVSTPHQKK